MILVTGAKGFIGRNLVSFLEGSGEQIFSIDRVDGDVFEQLNDVSWRWQEITQIYHLGAVTKTTETNVDEFWNFNVKFSIALMEMAIRWQIPIHYASSAAIYGNSKSYESNPLNQYALSKLMVDLWVKDNISRFKKTVTGFRLFNVYGKDENKDSFSLSPICKFTEQAKTDGIIKIFKGSENFYRDFVCVEDVVKIMTGKHSSTVLDVGTSAPMSFLEVAELISNKYNALIKILPFPDVLKHQYQTYTKSQRHIIYSYKSVRDWLKDH